MSNVGLGPPIKIRCQDEERRPVWQRRCFQVCCLGQCSLRVPPLRSIWKGRSTWIFLLILWEVSHRRANTCVQKIHPKTGLRSANCSLSRLHSSSTWRSTPYNCHFIKSILPTMNQYASNHFQIAQLNKSLKPKQFPSFKYMKTQLLVQIKTIEQLQCFQKGYI